VTTANEFRQYARECIDGARDSTVEPVRDQFLELAKLWLIAAARSDAQAASLQPTNGKGDGHFPADLVAAGSHEQS
jgi:hypothetical protein